MDKNSKLIYNKRVDQYVYRNKLTRDAFIS